MNEKIATQINGCLKKGDIVDLVLPASACSELEYRKSIGYIKNIGLVPRVKDYKDLVDESELFVSNSDEVRFNDLATALTAEDSKCVWCLRGGYGTARLLEKLEELEEPAVKKFFIGFSDATILLNYLLQNWEWNVIHGPVLFQLGSDLIEKENVTQLEDFIFGRIDTIKISEIKPLNNSARIEKELTSSVVGGCLSLVQTLIGTKHDIKTKDKILLLEDIGEDGYKVDRMCNHLYRAGKFEGIGAVILGNFVIENDEIKEKELEKAFDNLAKLLDKKNVPLLYCKKLGHTRDMLSVPLGLDAILSLGESPVLEVRG